MTLSFSVLPHRFAIVKLAADAAIPVSVVNATGFVSISRTDDELSIVCPVECAEGLSLVDIGWSAIKIHGPFAFDQVGILASFLQPLAGAAIGIFAVSTFDTDYILVKTDHLDSAIGALQAVGHRCVRS
jgi:uncharacterized protein